MSELHACRPNEPHLKKTDVLMVFILRFSWCSFRIVSLVVCSLARRLIYEHRTESLPPRGNHVFRERAGFLPSSIRPVSRIF